MYATKNGREALDWLNHTDVLPAAIILDLTMPIMDGRTFLSARRNDPVLARVPVLVLSAERDCSDLAQNGDINGLLPKLFSFENLLTAIETLHVPLD